MGEQQAGCHAPYTFSMRIYHIYGVVGFEPWDADEGQQHHQSTAQAGRIECRRKFRSVRQPAMATARWAIETMWT